MQPGSGRNRAGSQVSGSAQLWVWGGHSGGGNSLGKGTEMRNDLEPLGNH